LKTSLQEHIIERQNIVLNIEGDINESDLKSLQQSIVNLYKAKMGEILDKLFSELVPADVHINLDSLEIKLPKIDMPDFKNTTELVNQFEKDFRSNAYKAIKEKILKKSGGKLESDGKKLKVSKLNILENFLENGHYPAWASGKNDSIDKIFEELIQKSPLKIAQMVIELSKKNRSKIIDRIIYQFRSKYIDRLLSLLFQKNGKDALKLVENIRRRLGQRYQAMRGQKSVNKAIMSAAFEYILEETSGGKKLKYSDRKLSQYILEAIQSKYRHIDETDIKADYSAVKNEFKSEHSELDVLEYFLLNGSIPYWASTESKESVVGLFDRLTQKKLVSLQRMVEKYRNDEQFIRRLLLQFSTDQIFALLEPISSDISRFLKDLLKELALSNFDDFTAKEVILNNFLLQKGKISKFDISKAVFEKIAAKNRVQIGDFLTEFYFQLEQNAALGYELGRSELIRIIKELEPGISDKINLLERKREALYQSEKKLLDELSATNIRLENKDLEKSVRSQIIKERNSARKELQKIQQELLKIGSSVSDSILDLALKKSAIEKQLFSAEDADSKAILLSKINQLSTEIEKSRKKLLEKITNGEQVQDRQKYIRELEKYSVSLRKDQLRLEASLADLANALKTNTDKESLLLLKKQEKDLKKALTKIETEIAEANQIIYNYSPIEAKNEDIELSEHSKLDFLIFFLQYASIPWWASEYRERSIENIISEFSEKEPEKLRQAFQRVGRNPVIWQRLVNQLSEELLEKVLILLFPNFAGFAVSVAILLQKIHEAKILAALNTVELKYFKWSSVAETIFTMTTALNPQNFVKIVVTELAKEYNISPSTLLEYIDNLSKNNPGTRLSIFTDIVNPIKTDSEIIELEKELLEITFKRRLEDEGLVIPEAKKLEVFSDYLLKGIYQDITYKTGYSSPDAMAKLMLELMLNQGPAVEKILESALKNNGSRRRLSQEFPDEMFWELVLLIAPRTMPLVKKYISDLGIALSDNRMSVAKEALLKYLYQLADRPFLMKDYMDILLKDAAQITQRSQIAIINEWKRKVYQAPSYSSSLIIALMQAEMQLLKSNAEATEDQTEKEQFKDQQFYLQMELQQISQRLAYLLNKELPQQEGDFEIPADSEQLYQKIEETEKEIAQLKSVLVENPTGEALLQQLMTQKQIALLEGSLEVLKTHEPLKIRLLEIEAMALNREIKANEAALNAVPEFKIPKLPAAPELDEIEQLALDMDEGYLNLKSRLKKLQPEERDDWTALALEMGWDDILKSWEIDSNEQFLRELPSLSLSELLARWNSLEDKNSSLAKRYIGKFKVLIAKTVQDLKKQQRTLADEIENATSIEKVEEHKKALLQWELEQNDRLNTFIENIEDNNLRQHLMRIRNNIRLHFQKLRATADLKKVNLSNTEKEQLNGKIAEQKERRKNLDKLKKESTELLKSSKKSKEDAKVKTSKEEKKKKPEKPVDEPLFIRNAGLVILHPYYNRLFTTLNLTEKNKFVSEEAQIRAVHLLQYVATGKTEHPENDLVLNKILCGLPLNTPVPTDVGLTEEELKIASGLLSGAIANWPKLKTMSPDSLRGTFLLREGTIKEEADRWKLKVEKGSFDILLKTIPWAFNFVRYGWLQKFIMVEWQLPG
jgi:hypothetical protein